MKASEELLVGIFADIAATRMADVPILNPALHVAAVGFREWQGCRVGVLVTPWSLGLVLLPGDNASPRQLATDEKQVWTFPSGNYEFMGLQEPALGPAQMCPLLSPVMEFASQDEAVSAAEVVMAELFQSAQSDAARGEALADMIEDARLRGDSIARQQFSRRDFLRMPWLGH